MTYAAAAVMLAGALACSPRDRQETANRTENAAEDVRDATREGAQDVGDATREGAEEVREGVRDVRDYGYAQRADFRRDIDLRLKGLDEEIAELERDTKPGADKTRDSALVNIRAARKDVTRKLNQLGSATENNWDNLKDAMNQSLTSLQEAVRRERPDARPMGGTGPS
jgi:methyl-accepting chemotaxis protein